MNLRLPISRIGYDKNLTDLKPEVWITAGHEPREEKSIVIYK